MTDKELLELAAKAAGIEITPHPNRKHCADYVFLANGCNWNPLADDGDALRLAVKLKMDVGFGTHNLYEATVCYANNCWETLENDPYAATRRAIVRAAAEIGRMMG